MSIRNSMLFLEMAIGGMLIATMILIKCLAFYSELEYSAAVSVLESAPAVVMEAADVSVPHSMRCILYFAGAPPEIIWKKSKTPSKNDIY